MMIATWADPEDTPRRPKGLPNVLLGPSWGYPSVLSSPAQGLHETHVAGKRDRTLTGHDRRRRGRVSK
eukprot:5083439-Pyramimonas_sp.AAC.1